jgi:F0F1-type ATP synthase assembly protein I
MPRKQTQRGDATRAYSLGFELVCAVAGFTFVGFWIDRHYSSSPRGTLIGLLLGLIGGFYNLFRGASRTLHTGARRAVSPPTSGEMASTGIDRTDGPGRATGIDDFAGTARSDSTAGSTGTPSDP